MADETFRIFRILTILYFLFYNVTMDFYVSPKKFPGWEHLATYITLVVTFLVDWHIVEKMVILGANLHPQNENKIYFFQFECSYMDFWTDQIFDRTH